MLNFHRSNADPFLPQDWLDSRLDALAKARTMLEQGVIDEADFQEIAAFMARKFHPIFGDFFAEKPSLHSVSQ